MLGRFARWLHTGFPAGTVEPGPIVGTDGETAVPGVRVSGDLLGTPLLKLAVDSGVRAVRAFAREDSFASRERREGVVDLAIVGGGVSGVAAAVEAKKLGLDTVVLEAASPFETIRDFPARKPIFTYPTALVPEGDFGTLGDTKEKLLESLERERVEHGIEPRPARVAGHAREAGIHVLRDASGAELLRSHRVLVAVGKSGEHRKLGVPGEDEGHIHHRLHDPRTYAGRDALVVGGGDTAVETAIALADAGARVHLVHRGDTLVRPKPANRARLEAQVAHGGLVVSLGTRVIAFEGETTRLATGEQESVVPSDVVFECIGRAAPVSLLRAFGLTMRGERTIRDHVVLPLALAIAVFVFAWKSGGSVTEWWKAHGYFPFAVPETLGLATATAPLARTLGTTLEEPGFYFSLVYSLLVLGFGLRRIARHPTPYVRVQTTVLVAIQVVPLFLLPYFVLPALGAVGAFDHGVMRAFADAFFPAVSYGHGREYWRAFGFVLAWPLFVWNVFTSKPSWPWLVVSLVQTFAIIPWMVKRWGKGAYCGFVCSCGALAETVGDGLREKMPHGPAWNRLNLLGQAILAAVFGLLVLRIASWVAPHSSVFGMRLGTLFARLHSNGEVLGLPIDYAHVVDLFFSGILGVGLYVGYSGRTWCRFACPLAALMNLYARAFTEFRIFADKPRCISCGRCTAVCHQGIDVMHFAERGEPMTDPQCVRCSACVEACPTATLSFGRVTREGEIVLDRLEASPVRMREGGKVGLRVLR